MKKLPEINWNEWTDALEKAQLGYSDIVPHGWITPDQFAKRPGKEMTERHARYILSQLAIKGGAERRKFKIMTGGGLRPISHYKLK